MCFWGDYKMCFPLNECQRHCTVAIFLLASYSIGGIDYPHEKMTRNLHLTSGAAKR